MSQNTETRCLIYDEVSKKFIEKEFLNIGTPEFESACIDIKEGKRDFYKIRNKYRLTHEVHEHLYALIPKKEIVKSTSNGVNNSTNQNSIFYQGGD